MTATESVLYLLDPCIKIYDNFLWKQLKMMKSYLTTADPGKFLLASSF